ncbi:hypothetical protein DMP10_06510 [Adlercreutzia equolifaciens subsp. celatus DSM 18785]|uniref:Uncharacterized protein n=1 Tax=Adlercreutzia equolifaciens subsp. celatus DSM 18785 TaxID=1121021 RepID=A0A3N0ATI2_9ACTN|nr:hypothetical protein DX904_06295 [Adlercreutzia equolifaciens subsp. celatus]RNL37910.1 hypothetical protein DMP10_06510 [Adlercreutzia equolifaciens subsp. celatus DSM 18785]
MGRRRGRPNTQGLHGVGGLRRRPGRPGRPHRPRRRPALPHHHPRRHPPRVLPPVPGVVL